MCLRGQLVGYWLDTENGRCRRIGDEAVSPAERDFDIVLYGVTGFSGKLTAGYLARVA
jgi:hypothetical protein